MYNAAAALQFIPFKYGQHFLDLGNAAEPASVICCRSSPVHELDAIGPRAMTSGR
jgi:hypothetical protein